MAFLEARNISKFFGQQVVLQNLSFAIDPGECVLIYGPNGAGKSTLLHCLAGIVKPESGEVVVRDNSVWRGRGFERLRRELRLGFLPAENLLFPALTIAENLALFTTLTAALASVRDDLVSRLGLGPYLHKRLATCSQGVARKVGLARALLGTPQLLLLDEPFAHLDDDSIRDLQIILRERREAGAAIVIASHQREDSNRLYTSSFSLLVNDSVAASDAGVPAGAIQ